MGNSSPVKVWLHSKTFDLFYFQISGLLCLLLISPYLIWKEDSVLPIYNFYLIFFGMPHNFLTWAHILPSNVRKSYNGSLILRSAGICLFLCSLLPFLRGSWWENLILSVITYSSLWHAYRQHHGICKVYDLVQMQRTQDKTLAQDRYGMNLFFGLAAFSILIWAFTKPKIDFLLSADAIYSLIYPHLTYEIFLIYALLTLGVGIWGLKKAFWDRYQKGLTLPWPQFGLMLIALATYIVPYVFIPLEAIAVCVAIGTMFHNIQYFAFVWLMERLRAEELSALNLELHTWQKLAWTHAWKTYFGCALLYSFFMIGIYLALPHSVGLPLVYFLAFAHYIIDGHIWKREHNALLSPTLRRLAMS